MRLIASLLILLFTIMTLLACFTIGAQFSIVNYRAKPDGSTDSTKAFTAAWTQVCGSKAPDTMYVPSGRFLVSKVVFQAPCKNPAIVVQIDGTIIAPSNYNAIGKSKNWILFDLVDGVTLSGGVLDGQGSSLSACRSSSKNCPTSTTNVKVPRVKVLSRKRSNTNGIHVTSSTGVTILNSTTGTRDDCVSISPGTSNIIGSLGRDLKEAEVQNVTVKTATFMGSENGLRIKTWARPSSGFARNILCQHATPNNVNNPIVIDQNYCPHKNNWPKQELRVRISDVTNQDIHGTSTMEEGVKLDCSKSNPCTYINLEDVKLTYKNQATEASCVNANSTTSGFLQPSRCLNYLIGFF